MQVNQPQGGDAEPSTLDQRERFEATYAAEYNRLNFGSYTAADIASLREGDHYGSKRAYLNGMWNGWKAAESQPRPAAWVSVSDRLPMCNHECTTDHIMVSNTVLVTDAGSPPSLGTAHLKEDGEWKVYGGEFNFMNPETITHWMPMPPSPTKQFQGGEA